MRVLYVVSLFPCLSETFIAREIRALVEQGVDVRILSLKPSRGDLIHDEVRDLLDRVIYPPDGARSLVRGLAALVASPLRHLGDLGRVARGLLRYPVSLAKSVVVWWRCLAALHEVREWNPDWIHAHWATFPSTGAWLLSRATRIAFGFTAHAHDIFLEDHLLAGKLRDCAYAVTVSRANLGVLARHASAPVVDEKVHVIHCGVDLVRLGPALPPGRRRSAMILAVGRLVPMKGFAVLLDACARLRDQGVSFECRIIGDGPERAALAQRIEALRLGGQVALLGALRQEEVRSWMRNAAVFALPARIDRDGNMDGIPVALMEAMATGIAVVSTAVSGIPELVEDGVSGLLVPPDDPVALAEAIVRLLRDDALAQRLVEHARRTIEADFDARREAGKLLALALRSTAAPVRASQVTP